MDAIRVGRTDCQAHHGAAPRRCTAERVSGTTERGGVTFDELRPKCNGLMVERSGFVLPNEAHAQHMLACSTNRHGEEIIDSRHAETLSIELSKGGSNCTDTLRGFLHCVLFTKDHRTGLAVP